MRIDFLALVQYIREWIYFISCIIDCMSKPKRDLIEKNALLASQLALVNEEIEVGKRPKPKSTPAYRHLWVLLSKFCSDWKEKSIVFSPDTIIRWKKKSDSFHWLIKSSRKRGRPPISLKTRNTIRQIKENNPNYSAERIHDILKLLNIINTPAPNTITKYFPSIRRPPGKKQSQSLKTFFDNHAEEIWSMDFFTVSSLTFRVLYVLVIISHARRKIEHIAVTTNPNADWLKQELRNATPYDHKPKYLVHDNGSTFTAKAIQDFLASSGIKTKITAKQSPWQNPIAERLIKTLRQELTNHIIPLNESHLEKLLKEYIEDYYNTNRPHQTLNGDTPVPSPKYMPTKIEKTNLEAKPVLGGLYHTYKKAS